MILITEKAEIEFLENLRDIKKAKELDQWKCIICGLDERYYKDPLLKTDLVRLINMSDLTHRNVQIFWLHTGYIIVLCQSAIEPVFKTVKSLVEVYVNKDGHSLIPPRIINLQTDIERVEKAILVPITSVRLKPKTNEPIPPVEIKPETIIGTIDSRNARRNRFKPTLLSIEDDRSTARIIKNMMSPYCDVVGAMTAKEAEDMYENILPNIVFMDIELPDGNGKDMTSILCDKDPEAFIVMVSGHLNMDIIDECVLAGARGFITKPLPPQINRMLYFINIYNSEKRTPSAQKKQIKL